jgi:cyclic pyranopterin phosphate synthase
MPEPSYVWLPKPDILTFEETARLVDVFTELGVDKVRLTGGEPLLRQNVETLVGMLSGNPRVNDLAITTNGLLLERHAQSLFEAGLHRVTVSLDTLRAKRFEALTRRKGLDKVLHGIEAAKRAGFDELKIDSVIIRGTNEDELVDLLEIGKRLRAEVRFIEYMDVAGATQWSMERVFSKVEILSVLEDRYGPARPVEGDRWAPAQRFTLPDGTVFGIISSTTEPFCRTCDRSRLTADGLWYLCLYAQKGFDLRQSLRDGFSNEELASLIREKWTARDARGAELRKELDDRSPLARAEDLQKDPHREMHTRGG